MDNKQSIGLFKVYYQSNNRYRNKNAIKLHILYIEAGMHFKIYRYRKNISLGWEDRYDNGTGTLCAFNWFPSQLLQWYLKIFIYFGRKFWMIDFIKNPSRFNSYETKKVLAVESHSWNKKKCQVSYHLIDKCQGNYWSGVLLSLPQDDYDEIFLFYI